MKAPSWPRNPLRASRLWVRLALGFGTLVALMLVVVALAIVQFRALAQQAERLTQRDLQRMLLVQEIHQHAQGHGNAMARLLSASREERETIYPVLDAEYAAIERLLEQLATRLADADSSHLLDAVAQRGRAYREVFALVGEAIESDEAAQARAQFGDAGRRALKALTDAADKLLAHEQQALRDRQARTQAEMRRSEWLLAALAGVALLMSALFLWRTTTSVARPLGRVEAAAHRIAEGNYDTTVEVRSHDELGRVAMAINAMSAAVAAREAQIERLAFSDPLTGMHNRTKLRQLFHGESTGSLAVILMDVARLRMVNEVLGFDTGDALLARVAERLQQLTAAHEGPAAQPASAHSLVLARLAGGVFAVLWAGQERAAVERLRERIDAALATPVLIDGHEVDVQLVYGLAQRDTGAGTGGGIDFDDLLRSAEAALGQAKQNKVLWTWHVPVDHSVRARQLSLLSDLNAAVAAGELEMWLQPKQCLRNGRMLGMEALVRWRHAVRGYVSPAEFIPFIERAGHIGVVTQAMVGAALARLASWRQKHPDLSIAVNVSALDIQDMGFVHKVQQLAQRHGAPLERLRLEITESSVMDDADRVLPVLHALRGIGVQLSIDDFGTGYSSLAYLQRLPVDELKIDRSFVANADRSGEAQSLLRTIIELGHSLKMCVTAEGIERPEERALLAQLGCDMAQGYLISRPLDPQGAERFVAGLEPAKQVAVPA